MTDVIERIVRDLIRGNMLSRARALLSLFPQEYPHLWIELEASSGNWKRVVELYETLTEEMKEDYKALFKTAQDRAKEDYSEDVKEAFEEILKNNFEGAMAILEGISKMYPELVEGIALKLELARRKKDRARAHNYEEILRKLDPSHPVLVQLSESKPRINTIISWLNMMIAAATLALVLVLVIAPIGPSQQPDSSLSQEIQIAQTTLTSQINSAIGSVRSDIQQVRDDIDNLSQTSEKLGTEQSSLKEITNNTISAVKELENTIMSLSKEASVSVNSLESQIEALSSEIANLRKTETASEGSASVQIPQIYPDNDTTVLRSMWIFGYNLYRSGKYSEATKVLDSLSSVLENTEVYFKDDCYYYAALSSYMAGFTDEAKSKFDHFKEKFPTSQYVIHASYFLRKIEEQ